MHRVGVTAEQAGWRPVARSSEVVRAVLARRVATRDGGFRTVLLWRTRHGEVVAMDERCPHRRVSMARARLVGDAIECPVHGYQYGPTGRCINVRRAKSALVLQVCETEGHVWLAW